MQSAVPELLDLSAESAGTQRAYGMDAEFENTQTFGRQSSYFRPGCHNGLPRLQRRPPPLFLSHLEVSDDGIPG